MKIKILRIVLIVLILFWMYMVFNFSASNGDGSSSLSKKITSFFVKSEEDIALLEPIVRKIAHLLEYAFRTVS